MSVKPIVVQKYGGSSVADVARLQQVSDRVAATVRSGRRVVVVVSAMGKTTDQLLALAHSISQEPPRRELDMLLSTGERTSMALLAMALQARGIEAISFTGSQSGILTNDRHFSARILEVRPVRIEDELERDKVVIVGGFQGMSYKREITTLGRGGSDTTAVALAAALSADCEIYSDVDGVYSADPRVVPEAQRIESIGYEEMQDLALHGAKVLNPQAVEWARQKQIVIHARSSTGALTGPVAETRIEAKTSTARAGREILAVTGGVVTRIRENGEATLRILSEERVSLRFSSPREIRLVRDDVPDWSRVERKLSSSGARLEEVGEVTAVGPGAASPTVLLRALEVAGPNEFDSTPRRISLQVARARADEVVRSLHREFCQP